MNNILFSNNSLFNFINCYINTDTKYTDILRLQYIFTTEIASNLTTACISLCHINSDTRKKNPIPASLTLHFFLTNEHRMSAAEQLRHAPHTAVPGVTPAPPPYTQAMRMNSLNTLNGAGPQVGTQCMLNVCQIPKQQLHRRPDPLPPPSSLSRSSPAELRAAWNRSEASCQYCKAIAAARARYFFIFLHR